MVWKRSRILERNFIYFYGLFSFLYCSQTIQTIFIDSSAIFNHTLAIAILKFMALKEKSSIARENRIQNHFKLILHLLCIREFSFIACSSPSTFQFKRINSSACLSIVYTENWNKLQVGREQGKRWIFFEIHITEIAIRIRNITLKFMKNGGLHRRKTLTTCILSTGRPKIRK